MSFLCTLEDIQENQARGFNCHGLNLVAVKYRGQLYIYQNSCPHRSIPLEWQPDQFLDYEKTFIQCATHGALFKINNGECIAGPCVGDRLTAVPFRLKDNEVHVELDTALAQS